MTELVGQNIIVQISIWELELSSWRWGIGKIGKKIHPKTVYKCYNKEFGDLFCIWAHFQVLEVFIFQFKLNTWHKITMESNRQRKNIQKGSLIISTRGSKTIFTMLKICLGFAMKMFLKIN